MRLLFLTPQLPYPPRQGSAIRNWGLIRELAGRHDLTLLTFADAETEHDLEPLRSIVRELVTVPAPRRSSFARLLQQFSFRPDLYYRLRSRLFDAELRRLLASQPFDVIQIEGLEMTRALPVIRAAKTQARVVYDAHNVEHLLQRTAARADFHQLRRWPAALYSTLQWPRLRRWESSVCLKVNVVACVSAQDASALRKIAPPCPPVVVPNGLRVAEYPYKPEAGPGPELEYAGARTTRLLVFTGKMDYRPNVDAADWFVREILPAIHAVNPIAQFAIVGQNPPERLGAHADTHGVLVVGEVEDIRPYIAGAGVYVMPLRMGGGTRFKMLEAMALGVPVVSTRLGAEGFPVAHGRELLIADSADAFARAVLRLFADAKLRQSLSLAGRSFVEASYDWSKIVPGLEVVYPETPKE